MGTTNFEKFKQMIEQRNSANKPKSTGPSWFKPEKGVTHNLRFLPLKSQNLELPIEAYHYHAIQFPDGKFESFACKSRLGLGECPFCKLASETYKRYTATQNESYKEAFKQLVAKSHYLLVAYETDKIDVANITEKDVKIVRASSKAAMEKIDALLSKGKDFVDFADGRNCELKKPNGGGDIITINWDFDDSSQAFPDKNGKEAKRLWDQLVEVSPDLTSIVTPPTDEKLAELLKRYNSAPVLEDDVEEVPAPAPRPSLANRPVKKASAPVADDGGIDLDALRASLEN